MSDGMTLEEAKRYFQNITAFADERDKKACEIAILAIAALEAEPCSDAISREAILNLPRRVHMDIRTGSYEESYLVEDILKLPSVHAEPRTGHWIETAEDYYKAINEYGGGVNEDTPYFTDDCACSVCLAKFSVIDNETERFDYCPSCGAKMEEQA